MQTRKRKSVTGKCEICAHLSFLRRKKFSKQNMDHVMKLHALHKLGFMGERIFYYHRRQAAIDYPEQCISMITDGMAQLHSILPWQAGINQFSRTLPQHLQGTLVHGQSVYVYRTFNNVKLNANHQVHAMLLQLENIRKKSPTNTLPPTIYLQVDGGAENANWLVLAMSSYLVSQNLAGITSIVVTRLPVVNYLS